MIDLICFLVLAQTSPPPRDAGPGVKGTAVIRGTVTAADTKKPLRRVQVNVSSPALGPQARVVNTSTEGRYEVRDLPAGRYEIRVTRGGYLPMAYGQRRPQEPGKPLELVDGQAASGVDFVLPRMGVISGRVFDEVGDPIAGVTVWAMQARYFMGRRRLVPMAVNARTDDTGQYRLVSVPPGDYVITAMTNEKWTVEKPEPHVLGFAPTHYPGTPNAAEAQRVKVGLGQEAAAIDFSLFPVRAAKISGTAYTSTGAPLVGDVGLMQEVRGQNFSSAMMHGSAKSRPDGSWTLSNVPPGEFVIEARGAPGPGGPGETARTTIAVMGADIEGLTLSATKGVTVTGQIVVEGGAPPPPSLRVAARAISGDSVGRFLGGTEDGRVGEDGQFKLTRMPPGAVLRLSTLPAGWAIKSVEQGGRDITDTGIDARDGQTVDGVQIVLTNRLTRVRGRILDEKLAPVDGTVVIFGDDAAKWGEESRFVRAARPDQSGQFDVRGLPPGGYHAIALEYVQEGQWTDPEFLDELKARAIRFALADGEARQLDLTLRR